MNNQPIDPRALKAVQEIRQALHRLARTHDDNDLARIIQSHFAESVNGRLLTLLSDLTCLVRGECPSLLDEDSGGDSKLSIAIEEAISLAQSQPPSMADELAEALREIYSEAKTTNRDCPLSSGLVRAKCEPLLARYDAQKGQS